jgi:hypothetical protein
MIGFELEDKFAYPSHPVIGAPGAFTNEQLQEIVDYGLERYIQIVPVIQSPAHMAYVLKHPEFKDVRATCERCPEGLNYQACLCDEGAYDLIFDMYQDVIDATKGVDYFFVSTDEVYYAGICDECEPPYRWEDLSSFSRKSRSLAWVKYVRRAHDFLEKRDRRMLAWVEYPVLAEDISELPPDIINGVQRERDQSIDYSSDFLAAQLAIGIDGLNYVSIGSIGNEGLRSIYETLSDPYRHSKVEGVTVWDSENPPIGVFGAAWDDGGPHNETFWLGWSTVAQYGWTPGTPFVEQHVSEFWDTYYGPGVQEMRDIYVALAEQRRFYQRSWDSEEATELKPRVGGYHRKLYDAPRNRTRRTLPRPAMPELFGLEVDPVYVGKYGELVENARELLKANHILREKILDNMYRADRNHYNLEVLLSLADFSRHHNEMIISMQEVENRLQSAEQSDEPQQAVQHLISAYQLADETIRDRRETFQRFKTVWEKSRYPKGRSVNGRDFYHVLDDVKDHIADRRPDLSFYIAPEERINMESWKENLAKIIKQYAAKHHVSAKDLER